MTRLWPDSVNSNACQAPVNRDTCNSNACQAPDNRDMAKGKGNPDDNDVGAAKVAGVASEPPLACLPESFNSHARQAPDNRDTSKDTDDSFNSNACPSEKEQIESEYFELRQFGRLHEDEVNPRPCVQIACDKLDDLLTKYIFVLAKDYLNENRQTLYELCEGLPSPSWHRCIVQISLIIASFAPPRSSEFSCCTVSFFQSRLNPVINDFCKKFKTRISGPDYAAFFCLAA